MPIYREDLEGSRCQFGDCPCTDREGDMYVHSRCHPEIPFWVVHRGDVVSLECALCERRVASFVVASREHDAPRVRP